MTIASYYVNVCNIGNRAVNIEYLGFVVKNHQKSKYDRIFNLDGTNSSGEPLNPTEVFEVVYPAERLAKTLQRLNRRQVLYLYLRDTEGKTCIKKFCRIDDILNHFGL